MRNGPLKIVAPFALLIFLLITSAAVVLYTPNAEGIITPPRLSVYLQQKVYEVDVRSNMTGSLEIDGAVIVEDPWPQGYSDFKVTLTADTGGWEYEATEGIVLTEETPSSHFTITLHIPLETSNATVADIPIGGNWVCESKDESGSVISETVKVRIEQYYQFSISSREKVGDVKSGEELGYLCRLINEGNGKDRIRLEIVNIESLTENGINVTLSQDKFQVPEKQEKQFTVNINTSASSVPGNYTIHIRALSAQAEGLGEVSYVSDLELSLVVEPEDASEDAPFPQFYLIISVLVIAPFFALIRRRGLNL